MSAVVRTSDRRVDILGVRVNVTSAPQAVATLEEWIAQRSQRYACVTGAHGIMECRRDERLREIHNTAGMVAPDGMPLVWFSRLLRKAPNERVYGPELMRRMMEVSSQRGYRNFYYGGAPGLAETLKREMQSAYPGLAVVGTLSPPFRELTAEEDEAVIRAINAARPDIVWVGLSTPKQEFWMAAHVGRIQAPVLVGVGAAFDFLAGTKRQAPPWMQRSGLEWLFRLATEPRRLWRRYAYIVPGFSLLALRELFTPAVPSRAVRAGGAGSRAPVRGDHASHVPSSADLTRIQVPQKALAARPSTSVPARADDYERPAFPQHSSRIQGPDHG